MKKERKESGVLPVTEVPPVAREERVLADAPVPNRTRGLKPNLVGFISDECRDIGYGVESGIIEGFWTGEIDYVGKRTIRLVDGGPTLYLFPDEIIVVEY